MAPAQWWREAARVRTVSLAVACAGAAWALHRYRRRQRERHDPGDECCSPERPVRHFARRRATSEDLRSQAPAEDRRLEAHADAALKLNQLYLTALDGGSSELEIAYSPEAPLGIVCTVRPRCLCATAAVMAISVAATLLALHAAVTISVGLSLLVLLGGAVSSAALALHWAELKNVARRHLRAAVARASLEVQPEAAERAWRAALAWASAPPAAPGRARSFARRGSHCVLVEAWPSALVAAPLDVFVLEPRGAEDNGGLRISSYVVPVTRRAVPELTTTAASRLRQLLGEAAGAEADADDAEAAGGLGPGFGACCGAGRPLLRPLPLWRRLRRLEAGGGDASHILDKDSLAHLRVAGKMYEACRSYLTPALSSSFWSAHEKNDKTGIEWAIKLDSATSSVVVSWEVDCPHTDVIKVLAIQLEWDLRAGTEMDPEARSAKELCGDQGNPYIGTWHVLSDKEDGTKEDIVAHTICLDALADPQGTIWCIVGPTQQDCGEYLGASLPSRLEGHTRPAPDGFLWGATLTPYGPSAADRRRGFRMRGACRLPAFPEALARMGSRMPSFLLRPLVRTYVEQAASINRLVHVVETKASDLEERLRSSPRAELYGHLRRQLSGEPQPP